MRGLFGFRNAYPHHMGRWMQLVALILPLGCGGGGPPGGTGDAGATADGSTTVDGLGSDALDAPSDATPPVIPAAYQCDVAVPGTVRVRTASPNVTLLIHDVFGSLVNRTTSGTTGIVDIAVPGCGSVTSIRQSLYHTVTHVAGGDELWIEAPPGGGQSLQGPARLYIDNPIPAATSYWILGPISSSLILNEPTTNRYLYWSNASLTPQGLVTIVVHPADAQSGYPDVHNYAVFENVSLAAAVQTPLHVTSWSTQSAMYHLHIQLPAPAKVISAALSNWTNQVSYSPVFGDEPTLQTTHEFDYELASYGEGLLLDARFLNSTGQARGYRGVIAKPATPAIDLDLSQALLPELTAIGIVPSATRPTITWNYSAASGVTPDLTLIRTYGPVEWRFALPPGPTSYQLPELPPDLAHDFSGVTDFGVSLYEANDYPGYAVARARFVETFVAGRKHPMGVVVRWSGIGSAL